MFVGIQLQEWDQRVIDFWIKRGVSGVGLYIDIDDTDQNFAILADRVNHIGDSGSWPMVTITAYHTPNQTIINGDLRGKLIRFGGLLHTPTMIRPLHEGNGTWYPWHGESAVTAGLAIIDGLVSGTERDLIGCWSPNIDYPGVPLPARSMVPELHLLDADDYIGFDAYHIRNHDLTVDALTISQQVAQFHQRWDGHPIHLFETGSADTPEHWIEQLANIRWLSGFWWADYNNNLGEMQIRGNRKALRALDSAMSARTRRLTRPPDENPPPTIPRPTMRQYNSILQGNPNNGTFAQWVEWQMCWAANGEPVPPGPPVAEPFPQWGGPIPAGRPAPRRARVYQDLNFDIVVPPRVGGGQIEIIGQGEDN